MNFKAWFKSKSADKVLLPLRKKLVSLIDEKSTLIEIGSGTGDLLFKLSDKISSGVGYDLDSSMIRFANTKKNDLAISNLNFYKKNILEVSNMNQNKYDIATTTLSLHEMSRDDAIKMLKKMSSISRKIITADFAKTESLFAKMSLEFDEFISGHYMNFRNYRKKGGMDSLLKSANLKDYSKYKSSIDGIEIWVIENKEYN